MINSIVKRFGQLATASTLLCTSVLALADAPQDLEKKLTAIDSFKADFSQVITDEFGTLIDKSSGHFELQRPQLFRWVVSEPFEQEIVADGVNLWQFDIDIEQINVSSLDQTLANSPAALLSQAQLDVATNYEVASVKGEGDEVMMYHLMPRDPDALYEVLIIEFKGDELVALQVRDNLGQSTLVDFTNVVMNPEFDDNYFEFEVPEGVDVIDSRNSLDDEDESF
ncbi:outer membrane lipoprotein chaperone LolA [Kangiella sp.]|uniref:outer membrane lipoprotein chaperone LolA n=1 Tax=Kangiella sp. TaxID=1920245 RepID=UPI001995CB61|nr:outer membrane lipoprotein chaperone LolA [Kangiella sp.]MBD3654334.1 outer membrane lipoprotein chaperone LolA [Kangiella sp.]